MREEHKEGRKRDGKQHKDKRGWGNNLQLYEYLHFCEGHESIAPRDVILVLNLVKGILPLKLEKLVLTNYVVFLYLDVASNPCRPSYGMASDLPLNLFDCQFKDVDWQYDQVIEYHDL